ncbi:ankyrin repeats [Ceratobasidium sp. AG-Ba]|nr:ankyrin repeats [Ceratobasidium sp. AG-Ba]
MRNPDPGPSRFTSLAWAAVLACEEVFEFLLEREHDEEELSRDAENNTILILLAGAPTPPVRHGQRHSAHSQAQAHLRMARLYLERYAFLLDWPNVQGMTALHQAALKGNEEFVRMLLDLGADFDLPDQQGNTPLHYASAWGHVKVVQLLIERGCQFAARNNEGFTASDYAYSVSTMNTLQDTVRVQFENNKKQKAMMRNNRRISEDFEDYGRYTSRLPESTLGPVEHNRFRSGSASTSEGTIDSRVRGESRPDITPFQRHRSGSSSSSGAPESSVASGVGSVNGSQQGQISGSRRPSASNSNKALPPPPLSSIHPYAASQFPTPTKFPTPLQSRFTPPANLPLDQYVQHIRNHPIAGEPMAPPASPGRRLRAVASANALGAAAMSQMASARPKRAGTNEGLGISPGSIAQGYVSVRSVSAVQSRSGSVARPPPAMPPPSGPIPETPGPPTPPPKSGPVSSSSLARETPKREQSNGSGRDTPKSGTETPKKDGKETPGRGVLGLRAGVVGVVKPMLSPSALNGSFFSRGTRAGVAGAGRLKRRDELCFYSLF